MWMGMGTGVGMLLFGRVGKGIIPLREGCGVCPVWALRGIGVEERWKDGIIGIGIGMGHST